MCKFHLQKKCFCLRKCNPQLQKLKNIFVVEVAEGYREKGNEEYKKKNFDSAIHLYTEGIKVNCKDKELNAKLYSNRAAAHLNLGEKFLLVVVLNDLLFCLSKSDCSDLGRNC